MGINFIKPMLLLLLPFAVAAVFFIGRKGKGSVFQRGFLTILRSLLCVLLILAMSGVSINRYAKDTTTIFAVDLSDSVRGAEEKAGSFLESAILEKGAGDKAGIVCFGEKAAVEITPTKDFSLTQFKSYVNKSGTNISDGLKTAAQLLPKDTKKRIVLLSDGNETLGDVLAQARLLNNQSIRTDVYRIENNIENEVQMTEIKIPPYINKAVEYEVTVTAHSLQDTSGRLRLYKGNTLMVNEEVVLREGENNFSFSDISNEGGGLIYRAEIEATDDTLTQNNKAFQYCYVEDVPRILIIEREGSGTEIKKILEGAGLAVTVKEAAEAPNTMEMLNLFDSIVLADVPIEEMSAELPALLENYVKHTGGGLLVGGGEHSYALGGYYGTPLEEILPVEMELKSDSENPDLGMVMVIDRSGSMSSSNYGLSVMEIAKEAAIRGIEDMNPRDMVGVVAFDSAAEWAVPLQRIEGNLEGIKESIGKIQPNGGTSILPALKEGYDMLKGADTKLKHMILLTDGQAEQNGYDGLLKGINDAGITLSCVAVGSGADTKLLKSLAEKGHGRYYFTSEFTNLPEIFTKEAFLAGREYINNRSFYPRGQDASPIMDGILEVAQLDGYIAATAKPRADVILKSDRDDPILASWQYGLGRTAAWTSDLSNQWTEQWLQSDAGIDLIQNAVSWTVRKQASADISVSGRMEGEESILSVQMPFDETVKKVSAVVLSSGNDKYDVELSATAPGTYEGKMGVSKEGAYIVSIQTEKEDGTIENMNTGFNLPYSAEYDLRSFNKGQELLQKIAEATGGKIIDNPNEIFSDDSREVYEDRDFSMIFLLIALCVFLIDIALRRFSFLLRFLEIKWNTLINQYGRRKRKKAVSVLKAKEKEKNKPADREDIRNTKEEKKEEKQAAEPKEKTSTASLLAKKKRKR